MPAPHANKCVRSICRGSRANPAFEPRQIFHFAAASASWPGLSRPSTFQNEFVLRTIRLLGCRRCLHVQSGTCHCREMKDVDGRDKPGHDDERDRPGHNNGTILRRPRSQQQSSPTGPRLVLRAFLVR
jgi:hypothetical protein